MISTGYKSVVPRCCISTDPWHGPLCYQDVRVHHIVRFALFRETQRTRPVTGLHVTPNALWYWNIVYTRRLFSPLSPVVTLLSFLFDMESSPIVPVYSRFPNTWPSVTFTDSIGVNRFNSKDGDDSHLPSISILKTLFLATLDVLQWFSLIVSRFSYFTIGYKYLTLRVQTILP